MNTQETPCQTEREVIDRYFSLVAAYARKMQQLLPPFIDVRDLCTAGLVGLLESWRRFDAARNVKFLTFAAPHIRGAMIDYLRTLDPASRFTRQFAREERRFTARFEVLHGRPPSREEIVSGLGLSWDHYYDMQYRVALGLTLSLEGIVEEEGDVLKTQAWAEATFSVSPPPDPAHEVERREFLRKLPQVLAHLSERQRQVITQHYFGEMTLWDIGEQMGLTEGRISQIEREALVIIRRVLGVKERKCGKNSNMARFSRRVSSVSSAA